MVRSIKNVSTSSFDVTVILVFSVRVTVCFSARVMDDSGQNKKKIKKGRIRNVIQTVREVFEKSETLFFYTHAEYFMRFCFCLWLQNQTRTTFFLRSSFSAMAAIFSDEGRGWMAK